MDALKKLLEQAQKLQEAALQAELDKIRIKEQSSRPREPQGWSNEGRAAGGGWSNDVSGPGQQWSGQGSVHSAWVDPASVPLQRTAEVAEVVEPTLADRLRDPETLRTFFLMAEAFGPPPGLREDDEW